MKKVLVFVLVAAMVLVAACKNEAPAQKGALDVIKARTSIRAFTGEKLTEEQIHTLLDAAMAAPTDGNRQPWRFVVITDDEMKVGLYEREHHQKMVADAGAVIVVCGQTTRMGRPRGADPDSEPKDKWNPDNIHYDRW